MNDAVAKEQLLVKWYAKLRPINIDIVGDFAGQGLFAVHGESLIRHCLGSSESQLDFKSGFQLLHAVYEVELFLSNLHKRDCNFDVIFFDSLAQTCIPRESSEEDAYKYLLARSILIRHLARPLSSHDDSKPRPRVFRFNSLQDEKLEEYLTQHTVHFLMCHDGDDGLGDDSFALKHLIHTFLDGRGNIALIQFVQWQSSRVFAPIMSTQNRTLKALRTMAFPSMAQPSLSEPIERIKCHFGTLNLSGLSVRENITLQICGAIRGCSPTQNADMDTELRLQGLILHLATLKVTSLQDRQNRLDAPPPCNTSEESTSAFVETWDETTACGSYEGSNSSQKPGSISQSLKQSLPRTRPGLIKIESEDGSTQAAEGDDAGISDDAERPRDSGMQTRELEDTVFLRTFGEAARVLMDNDVLGVFTEDSLSENDSFDLVDGRIFHKIMRNLRDHRPFCQSVVNSARLFIKMLNGTLGVDEEFFIVSPDLTENKAADAFKPNVLAFSHPVVSRFLPSVQADVDADKIDPRTNFIFRDLHHWHSHRRLEDRRVVKPKWWVERKRQRRMADVRTYAISLTNSIGKESTAEPIVSRPKSAGTQTRKKTRPNAQTSQKPVKENKPKGGNSRLGGRAAALAEAKRVQESKSQSKTNDLVLNWRAKVHELAKIEDLVSRYLKTERYYNIMEAQGQAVALGAEIQLYLCHTLSQLWKSSRGGVSQASRDGLYLIAMIVQWLLQCSKIESPSKIAKSLRSVAQTMGFEGLEFPEAQTNRSPCFTFILEALKSVPKVVKDYRPLQLEFGGPYLERSFDSKPDERVPFDPDAWQREVLDSIDADNSQLVIAPTSAGKTFISFYAMKKILQDDDDGVLVYVAPTKALVNQIAAEIEARFSKNYSGKAKSIWAIYTRDYRVNNPLNCQVLVTVPHILQIMLLSPTHATGPHSWSNRVKRIIFDEVHCIGQNDDGLVWEQLLLQAPCPITALSATVGNPEEFCDWLRLSQESKGHRVDLIIHNVRYSELRKFIYEPNEANAESFGGLSKAQKLPVPGLDEGDESCPRLKFLHPMVSLSQRNRAALGAISFESRDCLSLFHELQQVASIDEIEGLDQLDPTTVFPSVVTKAHVVEWESKLKVILDEILQRGGPALEELKRRLTPASSRTETFDHIATLFRLACDLNEQGALPALVFNYDRLGCEDGAKEVLEQLIDHEDDYKKSKAWVRKLEQYEEYLKQKSYEQKENKAAEGLTNKKKMNKAGEETDKSITRTVLAQQKADKAISIWDSFDPNAPLRAYSFADHTKMQPSEFEEVLTSLEAERLQHWQIRALERGIGVHHAGMNRRYRQVVEMLFRRGYLRLVIATGTLALGINMPCKTVIFSGDSLFLTAQNYRQASGRAGRRGFDLLGNVVFNGIPRERVYDIMSSRLPDLKGQFPISTTLVLRCMSLLHGTNNSAFAIRSVESLLSQTRLYLGGPEAEDSIKHHLRFSIEYLRRQHLLSAEGVPLNFSGLITHLYFTENSAFAFHSLLKGGYFHKLCSKIGTNPERVCLELMLVLSHLFGRQYIRETRKLAQKAHTSPSIVFLPKLPTEAAALLVAHNKETLGIFKRYVHCYISQNLEGVPDCTLPFTKVKAGNSNCTNVATPLARIRSPFVALSKPNDDMESIHELCHTVRGGVFLEELAIPYIPVWPLDTKQRLNAYLYDFYKHGSMQTLVKDNEIKGGDVWQYLKDFDLVISAIVTSLEGYIQGDKGSPDEVDGEEQPENADEAAAEMKMDKRDEVTEEAKPSLRVKVRTGKKTEDDLAEDWDEAYISEDDGTMAYPPVKGGYSGGSVADSPMKDHYGDMSWDSAWGKEDGGGGLDNVLTAFNMLKEGFHDKFVKVWA